MRIRRRELLRRASAVTLGFAGWRLCSIAGLQAPGVAHAGDGGEAGVLALPDGFTAVPISIAGEPMDDGLRVPGRHDGMASFAAPDGRVLLVRNHELAVRHRKASPYPDPDGAPDWVRERAYDAGSGSLAALGCTTTLVYDPARRRLERHFLSLAGTLRNCGGGATPWGSWISCEETFESPGDELAQRHGYCFEVPARADRGLAAAVPLRAMGRFNHEAIAIDAASGVVYLTEDRADGLLYRFIPERPGTLVRGGRLQALALRSARAADTRGWTHGERVEVGDSLAVRWIDLEDADPDVDELRDQGFDLGAARFARGEGLWTGADGIYFSCTEGGVGRLGQVWRYTPSAEEGLPGEARRPGRLSLYYESEDSDALKMPDNLTVRASGDLYVCEDSPLSADRLIRITPDGRATVFASNVASGSELAGATFSPDGRVLFVNVQKPGITLAIHGPFGALPR